MNKLLNDISNYTPGSELNGPDVLNEAFNELTRLYHLEKLNVIMVNALKDINEIIHLTTDYVDVGDLSEILLTMTDHLQIMTIKMND